MEGGGWGCAGAGAAAACGLRVSFGGWGTAAEGVAGACAKDGAAAAGAEAAGCGLRVSFGAAGAAGAGAGLDFAGSFLPKALCGTAGSAELPEREPGQELPQRGQREPGQVFPQRGQREPPGQVLPLPVSV